MIVAVYGTDEAGLRLGLEHSYKSEIAPSRTVNIDVGFAVTGISDVVSKMCDKTHVSVLVLMRQILVQGNYQRCVNTFIRYQHRCPGSSALYGFTKAIT